MERQAFMYLLQKEYSGQRIQTSLFQLLLQEKYSKGVRKKDKKVKMREKIRTEKMKSLPVFVSTYDRVKFIKNKYNYLTMSEIISDFLPILEQDSSFIEKFDKGIITLSKENFNKLKDIKTKLQETTFEELIKDLIEFVEEKLKENEEQEKNNGNTTK